MEINITWNICRVCLKEEQKKPLGIVAEEPMRHLFNEDKQLAKQIYECSGITMKPNDSLPEKICKKCLTMVKQAVNFRKTCRASDTYLQSLLQRTKSATTLFKPQWQPVEDFEDDVISYDNNEDEDVVAEEPETSATATQEAPKQSETLKRKAIPLAKSSKKVCQKENSSEINSINSENLIAHDDDDVVDVEESDLNNIVEEVLDHSDAPENDNTLSKNLLEEGQEMKPKSAQDFNIQNDGSAENENDYEETPESVLPDIKHNNEEFYYVVKDEINENATNEQQQQQDEDGSVQENLETDDAEDDNVQYMPDDVDEEREEVDEEQLLHLESDIDDNQAQVSSTVVTKEDQEDFIAEEGEEQNSNLSSATNDLQTEYIVDEYLLDDSSSNISSRTSSVVILNSKMSNNNRTKTVLPQRKDKLEQAKATTSRKSASVGGNMQVWVCDLCGNHFGNRQLLNAHMKIHRQEKNHECELCSKRFITACNLQAHMRIHTGEKPFECQYCGRRFSDRSSNLRHERIHTNEKPFQCNVCNKAFSLATTLKKHMKVHTGERSYRCESCAKSFKLPHQLKAHKNTTLHKAVEQLELLQN